MPSVTAENLVDERGRRLDSRSVATGELIVGVGSEAVEPAHNFFCVILLGDVEGSGVLPVEDPVDVCAPFDERLRSGH